MSAFMDEDQEEFERITLGASFEDKIIQSENACADCGQAMWTMAADGALSCRCMATNRAIDSEVFACSGQSERAALKYATDGSICSRCPMATWTVQRQTAENLPYRINLALALLGKGDWKVLCHCKMANRFIQIEEESIVRCTEYERIARESQKIDEIIPA